MQQQEPATRTARAAVEAPRTEQRTTDGPTRRPERRGGTGLRPTSQRRDEGDAVGEPTGDGPKDRGATEERDMARAIEALVAAMSWSSIEVPEFSVPADLEDSGALAAGVTFLP